MPLPLDPHSLGALGLGLSSALVAGVFQAFSDFVMAALKAIRPEAGAAAMQAINRTVFRSVFLLLLLALGPAALGYAAWTAISEDRLRALLSVSAAIAYLLGVLGVTMARNVPMNEHLAALGDGGAEVMSYWQIYARRWTRWNHVRTLSATAAAAGFLLTAILPATS